MAHLSVHAVNIYVRDQDRSLRFYLDKLGFQLAFDARLPSGERWVAVTPRDGSAVLALIAPGPKSPDAKRIGRPTGVVLVSDDVTAQFREWSVRGVRFRHTPRLRRVQYEQQSAASPFKAAVWGGVFTRFEDVDRNILELVSFDAVSDAIGRQQRAIADKLEAERRAAQELEIATQVQARLFPQFLPTLKTLVYAGLCVQARQVGGDYYDFLQLGRERLGLVIGDIAGKGIAAALLMANLQANLRGKCAIALDQPQLFMSSINRHFFEHSSASAYATLFFAEYDDVARRLRYANCGHLAGLVLRRNGSVARLESTATVLGLFEEWECTIGEHQCGAGDLIALYTDGITESENDQGQEYGSKGLLAALRAYKKLPPGEIVRSIVDDVMKFSPHEQHDDITLIVAKCG